MVAFILSHHNSYTFLELASHQIEHTIFDFQIPSNLPYVSKQVVFLVNLLLGLGFPPSATKVTEPICEHNIRNEALRRMLGAQTMHGPVSNF
jgi:hypothetical protein